MWCCSNFLQAKGFHFASEDFTVDRIAVAEKKTNVEIIVIESLLNLKGRPFSGRIVGCVEVDDSPLLMMQDDESEEHAKSGGWDDEEIARDRFMHVVSKKRTPCL